MAKLEDLLGRAVFEHWGHLSRDVQEVLFETAISFDPGARDRLAIELHDRHPRTAHPPKPSRLA
jgi:hypothetical protein